MSQENVSSLKYFMKLFANMGLTWFTEESITIAEKQLIAACTCLSDVGQIPQDTLKLVLTGLSECSCELFRKVYDHLLQMESINALKGSQIFGNTLEALVGAIYLDKQYDFTKKWIIEKMIQPYLFMDELEQIDINIKNKIIGWALKQGKQIDFVLADEKLEGRRRLFTIDIVIDGEVITSQKGFTKKDASQIAAQKAIEILQIT